MKKISFLIIFLLILASAFAFDPPPRPVDFRGIAYINGSIAPSGTTVSVWANDGNLKMNERTLQYTNGYFYNLMMVWDDPDTSEDEGITFDNTTYEKIKFKINGQFVYSPSYATVTMSDQGATFTLNLYLVAEVPEEEAPPGAARGGGAYLPPPEEELPVVIPPEEEEEEVIPEEAAPPPEEILPEIEAPVDIVRDTIARIFGIVETGIDPEAVDIEFLPCLTKISDTEKRVALNKLDETYVPPEGYEVIIQPFALDCDGESLEVNLNIPGIFSDIKSIKCGAGICSPYIVTKTRTLECGDEVEEITRDEDYWQPEIEVLTGVLEEAGFRVIDFYRAEVIGKNVSLNIAFPSEKVSQPDNTNIQIIGAPFFIQIEGMDVKKGIRVKVPYTDDPTIDKSSIKLYVYRDGSWVPITSSLNDTSKLITGIIDDPNEVIDKGSILVAPIGAYWREYEIEGFELAYDPPEGSRAAVIMVHGLGSSPETFRDIIDDIRFTRQPWQAWTFAYSNNGSTEDASIKLANSIEESKDRFDIIYIVAHSLGGIVAEKALQYSYQQNRIDPAKYTYISKVKKAILIGSPHEAIESTKVLDFILEYLVNVKAAATLFNPESKIAQEILEGNIISRVPGIDYYVLAGTTPYSITTAGVTIRSDKILGITSKNDGFVTVESAQNVGGKRIKNKCADYWEVPATHTELIHQEGSRMVVEKIIAEEIKKALKEEALIGTNQYFRLSIDNCNPEDKYVVIGKRTPEKELAPDQFGCGCGDGICGLNENAVICPSDCLLVYSKPANMPIVALLVLIILIIFKLTRKKVKDKELRVSLKYIYSEIITSLLLIALLLSDIIVTKANAIVIIINAFVMAILTSIIARNIVILKKVKSGEIIIKKKSKVKKVKKRNIKKKKKKKKKRKQRRKRR